LSSTYHAVTRLVPVNMAAWEEDNSSTGSLIKDEDYAAVADARWEEENHHVDLHRGLKARHITMIAIGGAIGTGLIIGTGSALAMAGVCY